MAAESVPARSDTGGEVVDLDLLHWMASYQNVARIALSGVTDAKFDGEARIRELMRERLRISELKTGMRTGDEEFARLVAADRARELALAVLEVRLPPEQVLLMHINYRAGEAEQDYYSDIDRTAVIVEEDSYMLLISGIVDEQVPGFPVERLQPSGPQV